MKRIINIFMAFACGALVLASCAKDPIGGTATQAMAGQWYCTIDIADATGNVTHEDPYGLGNVLFLTYNTVDNSKQEMWLDDLKNFWKFKIKVNVDLASMTFSTSSEGADNEYYESSAIVTGGKIIPGGATTPHGTKADSFEFTIVFDDDYDLETEAYLGTLYYIHGYRYTGLEVDD